jgi:pantoate--beta-alanine ligase
MGALHEGHLSLIRRAREQCDFVVVSLFVNPAQFDDNDDLAGYPRQETKDANLAMQAGADLLFAPSQDEVYPSGFATQVEVRDLTDTLEGAVRGPEHFRGVATVVTKLFNMVMPDAAYFGQKDAQQVVVIRRLVADLNLPVRVEVCATVREADGLALSSRNQHLSLQQREQARALYAGLAAAAGVLASGEGSAEALLTVARVAMQPFDVEPEYLAVVDPDSFEAVTSIESPALLVVAARIGDVRLIDNIILHPDAAKSASFPAPTGAKRASQKVPA